MESTKSQDSHHYAQNRGGSRISGKGFICINAWEVRFAEFILFFLNIPCKENNLVLFFLFS